jgi:hypothetical protein
VVPTDFDIYSPKNWRKNALLQPESRAAYERLLKQGWTDALNLTKGRLRAQIASTQAGAPVRNFSYAYSLRYRYCHQPSWQMAPDINVTRARGWRGMLGGSLWVAEFCCGCWACQFRSFCSWPCAHITEHSPNHQCTMASSGSRKRARTLPNLSACASFRSFRDIGDVACVGGRHNSEGMT